MGGRGKTYFFYSHFMPDGDKMRIVQHSVRIQPRTIPTPKKCVVLQMKIQKLREIQLLVKGDGQALSPGQSLDLLP